MQTFNNVSFDYRLVMIFSRMLQLLGVIETCSRSSSCSCAGMLAYRIHIRTRSSGLFWIAGAPFWGLARCFPLVLVPEEPVTDVLSLHLNADAV